MEKEDGATLFTSAFAGCKKEEIVDRINVIRDGGRYSVYWKAGNTIRTTLERTSCRGVELFGSITIEKKLELMPRAHAILVPEVRGDWGLVVTKANAMGTPAICYKVPGLRDSVKVGETALACGPNPGAMAERVVELLQGDALLEELSRNALAWAEEFDWQRSAQEFLKAVEAYG